MIPGVQVCSHMRLRMSGCRTLNPAHNMSIKVGFQSHDMRMMGADCESAQHETIRGYHKYMMDIFMVQQQITGK